MAQVRYREGEREREKKTRYQDKIKSKKYNYNKIHSKIIANSKRIKRLYTITMMIIIIIAYTLKAMIWII
jgi:hypothetical protein